MGGTSVWECVAMVMPHMCLWLLAVIRILSTVFAQLALLPTRRACLARTLHPPTCAS